MIAAGDEDAFCMLRGKLPALGGPPCLKQDGRSLWRRFAKVIAIHPEILPLMTDFVDLVRTGKDAIHLIAQHGIVFPTSFPKLVNDLHEFLRHDITLIVRELSGKTEGFSSAIKVPRDNVPRDPPIGQVIEC